jgi:nucleoside-diphosphate-sugar epimerase
MKTILVTGGTGYIGSWVVKDLLEKAYTVRLTVRNKAKSSGYSHLSKIAETSPGKLEIWEADLLKEGSFNAAAEGSDAIMHIASPFTLKFKDAQKELIDPALNGTKNVLNSASASSTVRKIILTSSVAAVHGDNIDMTEQGLNEFTEQNYNSSSSVSHQPYSFSKVLAEKAAWEMAKTQDKWKLVVVNPSFVMGPSLSPNSSSESLSFMKDMLSGKFYLGAPDLQFGFVDVRDVAKAHLLALENPNAEGRHILAERTTGFFEMGNIIKQEFNGKYKTPLMKSPKFILYLIGWMFGLSAKFVSRNVGYPIKLNTTKSIKTLGLEYTPFNVTLRDMIHQMES